MPKGLTDRENAAYFTGKMAGIASTLELLTPVFQKLVVMVNAGNTTIQVAKVTGMLMKEVTRKAHSEGLTAKAQAEEFDEKG